MHVWEAKGGMAYPGDGVTNTCKRSRWLLDLNSGLNYSAISPGSIMLEFLISKETVGSNLLHDLLFSFYMLFLYRWSGQPGYIP